MRRFAIFLLACLAVLPARSAELQISGIRSMTEAQAADQFIKKRLEFLEKHPASTSLADDAAFLLEHFLVERGFTKPDVRWEVRGKTTIVLFVKEGPHSILGNIYVRGVSGDPDLLEELEAQIKSAHTPKTLRIGEQIPFLEVNNTQALTDARQLLKSKGYWAATVDLARRDWNPATSAVDLFVEARPGPVHHLRPPTIRTSGPIPAEIIGSFAKYHGKVATAKRIREIRAMVENHYHHEGYQFADVRMLAGHKDGLTQLGFIVAPGLRYRVGNVVVNGAPGVKPGLIEGRFRKLRGKNYNGDAVNEVVRALLGTGAFAGIRMEETPRQDGFIDLTLNVSESKQRGYYLYGGAGSFEGAILGAGYFHRNLWGNLWNLSTRAEWSGIGLLGEISVTEPRFLGYDLRFTASAFLTTRNYEGYDKAEAGLRAELEWEAAKYVTMIGSWTSSFVSVDPDGLPVEELGPETYLLNVFGLSTIYDRRDNPVLPKDGFYAKVDTDLGFAFGEGSIAFFRSELQTSYYKDIRGIGKKHPRFKPLTDNAALAFGGKTGLIVPSVAGSDLPIDLRYFLGGGSTVRSFPERDLGPKGANGDPRGGEAYWVASAEYIRQITGPFHGVLFFDAGSLKRDAIDLFAGDVKFAAGLGVRLDLPIGPVRLEYGHALDRAEGDPRGAFHFAIGASF